FRRGFDFSSSLNRCGPSRSRWTIASRHSVPMTPTAAITGHSPRPRVSHGSFGEWRGVEVRRGGVGACIGDLTPSMPPRLFSVTLGYRVAKRNSLNLGKADGFHGP